MTYIKELRNYFKFDNKLSRFRGPTHFRRRYKGLSIPEAKRLKYLDEENNQLKKLLGFKRLRDKHIKSYTGNENF